MAWIVRENGITKIIKFGWNIIIAHLTVLHVHVLQLTEIIWYTCTS